MNEAELIKTLLKSESQTLRGFVIGLTGTLGAGKTQLVKNLLKTIDPSFEQQVQSPTFNICNVYFAGGLEVHHFDLYRIETEEELYDIEIWESIDHSGGVVFIEWVDQFPELLEKCDFLISISIEEANRRQYEIKKN